MFNTEAICKYDVPISIRISNIYEYLFKLKKPSCSTDKSKQLQ